MRTTLTALLVLLTIPPYALAVDPLGGDITPLIDEGTAARQRGEWAAADAIYRRALDMATAKGDATWKYRSWFYIGLVQQMAAEAATDDASKRALREKAREPYRTALALNPKSKSVRINLSEIEWFLGDRATAIALLEGAMAVDPSPEVAEKLGDGYFEIGRRADAARVYSIAAEKNPDAVAIHEKLLKVLFEGDEPLGSELNAYLGALIERKQIDRAIDGAAQALAHPKLSAADGRAARALLAAALAQKDYDAASFRSSAAGEKITALIAGGSPQTHALQALVNAYDGTVEQQSALGAWTDDAAVGPGLPSSLDAYRAVLRSIGSTQSRKMEHDRAIAYYKLALSIDEQHVDPASVRALASIYATRGSYKQLSKLDEKYRAAMSALATAPADSGDAYEYFRLMGRVDKSADDGLHQFEQARAAAGTSGIAEPQLYEQLSDLYEKLGQTEKSNTEKFAAAVAYKKSGNLPLARLAIADLGHTLPDGVDDGDYKRMVLQLVYFPEGLRDKVPSEEHFVVKRDVLLLCAGGSKEDRVKATAELKKLGIAVDIPQRKLSIQRYDGGVAQSHFFLPVTNPPKD